MTPMTARWILWISLIIILPIPIVRDAVFLLPLGYFVQQLFHFVILSGSVFDYGFVLILQCLVWFSVLYGLAFWYSKISIDWPSKLRGSIMSLVLFVGLIIFASVPVYKSIDDHQWYTFMDIYEPNL